MRRDDIEQVLADLRYLQDIAKQANPGRDRLATYLAGYADALQAAADKLDRLLRRKLPRRRTGPGKPPLYAVGGQTQPGLGHARLPGEAKADSGVSS